MVFKKEWEGGKKGEAKLEASEGKKGARVPLSVLGLRKKKGRGTGGKFVVEGREKGVPYIPCEGGSLLFLEGKKARAPSAGTWKEKRGKTAYTQKRW